MHRTNSKTGGDAWSRANMSGKQTAYILACWLCVVATAMSQEQAPRWSPERGGLPLLAQADTLPAGQSSPMRADEPPNLTGSVRLDVGPQIQLRALVEIVIQRLGLKIIYDDDDLEQTVRLRAPKSIPASSLLPLLQTVLKANNLTLQDADLPGWKRIVPTLSATGGSRLPAVARLQGPNAEIDKVRTGEAITQAFLLERADANDVNLAIGPFLSPKAATSLALGDRLLIVTDFAANLKKVDQLVTLMDGTASEPKIEFIKLTHTEAEDISKRLSDLLQARAEGGPRSATQPATGPRISADARTNQLMIVGTPTEIEDVKDLVRRLDAPSEVATQVYALENTSAERMSELIGEMLGEGEASRFKSAFDANGNKLLITGSPAIQARVSALIKTVDVARSEKQSPVRFYQVKNVTAAELIQTLRSLEGQDADPGAFGFGTSNVRGISGPMRNPYNRSGTQPAFPGGASVTPRFPGSGLPPPADVLYRGQEPEGGDDPSQISLTPGNARITADPSSNTVIVVADPEEQRVYEELIQTLDQRRPQVMVEARLVLIDASDDFTLGVEVSGGDHTGEKKAFAFTSYGLSEVDPATGALSLIPGRGFNGTLVDPSVADVVVRALARHRRARVLSAPRLVVYDNATGVLASVNEEPFENSVVPVAGNTVQSFGGFAEAGTTIEVTPHISGDDYLRLEYTITVNTFTGAGTGTSPPPRKTDEINSTVTIPDGHTVIVGGLNQRRDANDTDGVPFLEKVPILRYLGGTESVISTSSSLFVFLRPVILRDDKFRNLRSLSEIDVRRAHARGDHPRSEPLLIK